MADYKVDVDVNVNDSKLDELESRIKSLGKNNNVKVTAELDDSKLHSSLKSKSKNQTIVMNADSSGVQKTIGSVQTALKNAAKSGQIKLQFDDNGAIKGINNIQQTIKNGEVVQLRVDGVDAVGNAFSAVQKLNSETDSPIEIKVNAKQLEQTKTLFQQTEADYKELLSIIDSAGKKKADLFGLDKGTEKARLLNEELAEMDKRADKLLTRSLDNFTDKQFNAIKQHEANSDYKLNWKIADAIDKDDLAQARSAVQATETDYKELLSVVKDINQTKIQLLGLDESSEKAKFLNSELERLESRANTIATRSFDNFTDKQLNSLNSVDKKLVSNLGKAQATAIDKANISSVTEEYKRLISTMKEIGSIRVQLQGLDEGSARAETLTKRLENLKVEAKEIFNSNTFSSNQMNGINNLTKNMDNALQDAKDKIIDVKAEIANGITKEYNAGDFSAQISTINRQMAELGDRAEFVEEPYRKLLSAHRELAEAVKSQDVNAITEAEERRAAALDKVNSVLTIQKNLQKEDIAAEKEAIATEKLRQRSDELSAKMGSWLNENSAAAGKFGSQIDVLRTQLKSCDAVQFDNINHQFKMIQSSAKEAGLTGLSFGNKLKQQFVKFSSYISAASVIMSGMQAARQGFQNVLDIDTKMTELKRVTDLTSSQYSDVYDTLTDSAQKYGATLTDLISQTADWSRAGFSDPDTAARLSEITSVYQHIADLDANTSMENLLTAYKGFEPQLKKQFNGDAAAAAEHIADVYNEIDNNYATTAADIGEAVKRSASALSLAGNTLEETAGMVTGINEVTQDPEKAGNSLKVLSMRLRGMKGELQDLGEETDENVENLSQMQGKVLNLTHGKVNIFDNAGDFKSTYEIMQGIAEVYDDLSSTDRADLLETIAGKNRANEVAALIQNWDRVTQATDSAENSANSAMEENAKYADSLQGRLDKLTSSLQTISNTTMNSGLLKGLVSGATEAINILNKVIDTLGVIPTVATVAGAAMSLSGKKFFDLNISKEFDKEADKSVWKLQLFGDTAKNIGSSVKDVFSNVGQVFGEVFNKINSKLPDGGKVFDFNKLSQNQIVRASKLDVEQLSTNITKLQELKSKIAEDIKSGAMPEGSELEQQRANIDNMLDGVSDKAKALAESTKLTNETIGEFSRGSLENAGIIDKNASAMSNAKSMIEHYNTTFAKSKDLQKDYANSISSFNPVMGNYLSGLKNGEASLGGYVVKLVGAKVATIGLQIATTAMNAALSMGISMLVSFGIEALMSYINRAQELSDKVKDITTSYKQQKEELQSNKKTIDSVSESYEKLSKGVNPLTNENVSLSTDEYSQYVDIVNQIADTFPTLVSGYDAQGNAVLTCAGNVEKLNEAYKEAAKNNFDDVLKDADDVFEDFQNKSKDIGGDGIKKSYDALNKVLSENNGRDITDKLDEYVNSNKDIQSKVAKALEEQGYDRQIDATGRKDGYFTSKEDDQTFINRVISENPKIAKEIVSDFEKQMDNATSGMKSLADAYIGRALIGGDYSKISDNMKTVISNIVPDLGYDYFSQFDKAEDLYKSLDEMMGGLNSLSQGDQNTLETYFDLQTKVNNGECSVGEYVDSVNKVKDIVDNLDVDDKTKEALKLSLQLDDNDIEKQYNSLKDNLTKSGFSKDAAKSFIDGLNANELKAAVDLTVGDDSKLRDTLDKYKSVVSEYDGGYDGLAKKVKKYTEEISKIEGSGIDVAKGKFNNIDLNNRQELNWDDQNIKKYSAALNSWDQKAKDVKGTISTVFGASDEFDGVEIAFSPMLQTDNGAELLSKNTVYDYINGLIDKAGEGWKNEDLFRLDTEGLDIDGKHISNLLADIGDTAAETGELMHDIGNKWTADNAMKDITSSIEKEAAYLKAMNFDIDPDSEKEGIESLTAAMAEARSGAGLTKDSFDKLNSRYKSLDNYDAARLFEETANGLSLNAEAVNEYENALNENKLKETGDSLSALNDKYESLTNDIKNCDDAARKAELIGEREDVRAKISELGELATMYEGLTSSYSKWQNAESSGNDRDMYQQIYSAQENIKKELDNGWIDDGTEEYFKLIWGEDKWNGAGKSVQDYRNQWAKLDKTIQGTNYSVSDFFTVNKDGELTSEGIFNFFDAVGQKQKELGEDWIQYDENGNMKSFNFGIDGDKAVADAMGVSEELVQIFLRASQDCGFVVDFSGTYTQFADMQNEANAAQTTLNDLFGTKYSFKFDTTSLTEAKDSLSDAKKEFAEKGIFSLDEKGNVTAFHETAKGAQEALQVVSALQANVDQLNRHYIGLTVEDDTFEEPLKKLQDYETKAATLNQLKLQPQVYSGQIEELEGELDNIVKYFDGLSKEQKVKFGIDGLSTEEIENKISSGEVKIPTTLDIQTQMSGDIADLKDIALLNSGILTDEQEDAIKKKLEIEWETENDTSKAEESEKKTEDELGKDSKVDKKTTVKNDVKYDNENDKNSEKAIGDLSKEEEITKPVEINGEIDTKRLQQDAQKAADAAMANLNLQKSGKTEFNFDFQSTNIKDLNGQISKAQALMDKFKNTDGNVDLSLEGASDAQTVLQTLIERKQELSQPAIMDVDISTIGDENLQSAISDMQQLQTLSNEREVKVAIGADTSDVDSKIQDVSGRLQTLIEDNPDIAAKLNLDTDDVQNALNSIQGTDIKADATLDPNAVATIQNTLNGLSPEVLAKVLAGDTSDLNNLTGEAKVDAKPTNTNLGGDFTGTGQATIIPASTYLGANFSGTGQATITPATTYLGGDFTGVGQVTATPVSTDFGNIFTGAGIANFTPASTYLGANFSGDGKANITPASTYLGGDFTGSGEADMSAKSKFLGSDFTGTGVVTVTVNKVIGAVKNLIGGDGEADGTAHVNGTAGKAFKNGNWGTKENGTALVGELGQELIVRDGHFFTVGDDGAEFVNYKKGDIVFNHKQTEELFKNGYVTNGGGRGRAFAEGTAFSGGTPANKPSYVSSHSTRGNASGSSSSGSKSSSNSNSSSDANKEAEKFEETLDWIETALDRVERAISRLDKTATSTYKNWTKRGTALNDQISQTRREIDLQNQAYNRYIQQANSVGLDAGYAAKVRDGTIDIETITDEDLNKKISDYQNWYNKALNCLDAIDDLRESESKLYEQRFENVSTKYDGYLGVIQHEKDMLDEFVSQTETAGYITSGKYYDAMSANAKKQQEELKKQRDEMISELNNAVNSGTIEKYSESWYSMLNAVDDVTKSIEECNTSLLEYGKNLRELDWQIFDLIQDKISKVADESEFLINLMSNKKLYEDNGQLTDEGMATMGQYGVKYNVYMAQANKYSKKIKELQADLAKDPYNQDIANQLQEYIEAQQEAILNAEDMKNSIKDMVSDGIDKELDSLQKLIDKRNDALDAAKDLYDYQKKIKESTKDIADLEKQMAAYQGDVSEETKAKIQQIKVDLEEAKSDLEETEYEQYISDQQKMLDDLYNDYETILNQRLDDIDALMADMISEINNNASTIGATIESQADKVGYTLSESMNTIWLSGNGSISSIITMYGTKFDTALTTTNTALGYINTNIQNMITQLNKIAGTKIKAAGVSSAATEKPTPKPSSTPTQQQQQQQQKKQVTVGGTINAGGARIYADSYGNGGGRQTFGSDPIYTVLQERNGYILTRWHKLSSGYTGWFKKSDVSAYALGAKNIRNNEMAWTQENGSEMIMRPSDGAILTPLAKNDSVLTSAASSNIWNMANNPSDFIKDNLDLDKIDTGANVGNKTTYTQNLDKVVFNLPNVKNYDELLKSMQHDKNFERLIMSMTIDPIAGKSSLAKGKAIR